MSGLEQRNYRNSAFSAKTGEKHMKCKALFQSCFKLLEHLKISIKMQINIGKLNIQTYFLPAEVYYV